jgi:hypothetical protein
MTPPAQFWFVQSEQARLPVGSCGHEFESSHTINSVATLQFQIVFIFDLILPSSCQIELETIGRIAILP